MAGRKRTVISPELPPRASKKPAARPREHDWTPPAGRALRIRPTAESPFGGFAPMRYTDDEAEVVRWREEDEANGIPSVIEAAQPGVYIPWPIREPVLVADLAAEGLATQGTDGAWRISPEGQRRIYEAMGL